MLTTEEMCEKEYFQMERNGIEKHRPEEFQGKKYQIEEFTTGNFQEEALQAEAAQTGRPQTEKTQAGKNDTGELHTENFRAGNVRVDKLLREIKEPGKEFSPMPFWFFNDAFDENRVRNQLEDFVEKGVNGFVLHPRIGIPEEMPYLSGEYFRAVRFIVAAAAELGMKVILYDEGMYPSGSAHGMVVEKNPEYGAKGIILLDREKARVKLEEEETAESVICLPDGRQIVYGFTGGTIRGIHFGEDDGEPGAPKAADILNPLAVEEFIRLTHDRYYEELKEYFGSTVIAFFTDEPSALGRNAGAYRPWVRGLEKEIEEAGGRLEELEGLFAETGRKIPGREDIVSGTDNETIRLYHRLIKSKLREIFYAPLSVWCEEHGIALMGHPAESDDIEEELYFHIPGQDLIMRRVSPETGGLREFDSVQAKLSADIARHLGRRRNANECFGVCYRDRIPWYMTAGDMKWYIDWLGMRGVNLYIPHAFYYSVEGMRKEERPPDVGLNNIWWKHYGRFSDYMKRLSYLMTDSVNCAELAVLCDNNKVPYEEIACLYENQIEFHYLPAAFLEQAQLGNGKVRVGKYAYIAVLNVLGEEYGERFGSKLGQLLVTVSDKNEESVLRVAADRITELDAAEQDEDSALGIWYAAESEEDADLESFRTGKKPVEFCPLCKELRMVRLNKMGADMLLFSNEGSETIRTRVTVSGMGAALGVDLWKGISYGLEVEEDAFLLKLDPLETRLVILDVPEKLVSDIGMFCAEEYPDWTRKFVLAEKENNRAVYILTYELQDGCEEPAGFSVKAAEMVECYCNGAFVDVSFWGTHRFNLSGFLLQGKNEIRLVVTGNAANLYENAEIAFGLE